MTIEASEPAVSIFMMLFGRLATLPRSLADLASQDYRGRWQLLLWNNNYSERSYVDDAVAQYQAQIDIQVVHSWRNHYCVARQALAVIAEGELAMMIDDDIIPSPGYLSYFVAAYRRLAVASTRPVAICACGHRFTAAIAGASAHDVWEKRQGLQFLDREHPETDVHFMHANNCMMPRDLLLKVAASPPPDLDYGLVDDYWMSYVLSSVLETRTIKIDAAPVFDFANDAFEPGVAMFNRRDVHQARLKLFGELSQRGWPTVERIRHL